MDQISPSSKPASSAEISDALRVLFDAGLPFQRGARAEGVALAYVESLNGMTLDGIHAGIRKFLRGECEDVSPRFVPTPPELARIVRTAVVPGRVPEARRIAAERIPERRPLTEAEKERQRERMKRFYIAIGRDDAAEDRDFMAEMEAKYGSDALASIPDNPKRFDVPGFRKAG